MSRLQPKPCYQKLLLAILTRTPLVKIMIRCPSKIRRNNKNFIYASLRRDIQGLPDDPMSK